MGKARRVAANLPEDLLKDAMEVSGKGLPTRSSRASGSSASAASTILRGKITLDVDLDESLKRRRR